MFLVREQVRRTRPPEAAHLVAPPSACAREQGASQPYMAGRVGTELETPPATEAQGRYPASAVGGVP